MLNNSYILDFPQNNRIFPQAKKVWLGMDNLDKIGIEVWIIMSIYGKF